MKPQKTLFLLLTILTFINKPAQAGDHYKNFKVAVYSRAYETVKMGDNNWIEPIWDELSQQLKVDKIYLETHRDLLVVDEATYSKLKSFSKAVELKLPEE